MKYARWEPCTETSLVSEMLNLQEVEANLIDLLERLQADAIASGKVVLALSFIRQASQALTHPNRGTDAQS